MKSEVRPVESSTAAGGSGAQGVMGEHANHTNTHHHDHASSRGRPGEHTGNQNGMPQEDGSASHHHDQMVRDFKRRLSVAALLTIPILVFSPTLGGWLGWGETLGFPGRLYLLFALASAIYFYGGYPFLKGLAEELRHREPGMMTLVGVAITAAYGYSALVVFGLAGKMFFWELAGLIDIMLLGHWIEMRSVMGASRALEALARLLPAVGHRFDESGRVEDVPLKELRSGDRVLVRPGERTPADGEIIEGKSYVNESMLTGESAPVAKAEGDGLIGGSVNGTGSVVMKVTKTGEHAYLAQIIRLVTQAQQSKSRTQQLAQRAAFWLAIIALGGGIATFASWWLVLGSDLSYSLERAVTVMVVACPHALGLAIPLVVAVTTSLSATKGLLIRNRAAFERARKVNAVIFDKTGTLTRGSFAVTGVIARQPEMNEDRILQYAGSLEAFSEHPIARAIAVRATTPLPVTDFRALPGKGVEGRVNGKQVQLLNPLAWRSTMRGQSSKEIDSLLNEGRTVVCVAIEGSLMGIITLGDEVRPESAAAIAQLRSMGIRCIMLTGDNRAVADVLARELGFDEVFSEVLPEQKAERVKAVQQRGFVVAMTGDGVNDAPALAQADVGIAIGAGTDVAIESADVVLTRSNPSDVIAVLELARAAYRKMRQNLLWATSYNVIALPLAAGVLSSQGIILSPALGAILMTLSTVVVALNARILHTSYSSGKDVGPDAGSQEGGTSAAARKG